MLRMLDVKMNQLEQKKILLTSTSTVSLHDRFTSLLKHQQQSDQLDITLNQQTAASLKNQRLAQELANRPSVLAALRNRPRIKKQLCKVSVKARLGQPLRMGCMGAFQGQMRGRGVKRELIKGISIRRGMTRLQGLVPALGVQCGRGQQLRGGHVIRAGPIGIRGGGPIRRTGETENFKYGVNPPPFCTGNNQSTFVSETYTGNSWARYNSQPVPSREQLDKQLDEYMSRTKSHLDAELDAYMAQVDLEDVNAH